MNQIVLTGNLVKDANLEIKANSGLSVCKFTIAVKRNYKKDEVDFINCVFFGKIAENIAEFTQKGSKVFISGSLRINSYTAADGSKRYSTEVVGDKIEFLSKPNKFSNGNESSHNVGEDRINDELEEIGLGIETPFDEGDNPFI